MFGQFIFLQIKLFCHNHCMIISEENLSNCMFNVTNYFMKNSKAWHSHACINIPNKSRPTQTLVTIVTLIRCSINYWHLNSLKSPPPPCSLYSNPFNLKFLSTWFHILAVHSLFHTNSPCHAYLFMVLSYCAIFFIIYPLSVYISPQEMTSVSHREGKKVW